MQRADNTQLKMEACAKTEEEQIWTLTNVMKH